MAEKHIEVAANRAVPLRRLCVLAKKRLRASSLRGVMIKSVPMGLDTVFVLSKRAKKINRD
ncbi:MAG: hypothetical protein UW81_C0015G0008 [Candidatus Giovannonibacteria bacterium GW2011_GWC2_44_9]|uniref:Uncharacterized protein n=3 Tax=Candidatus Giovannoniibacteriota TaxID=1752738 RepID=A0A0G1LW68_9BACT|nr:MAG: hypothetical protein UW49_C0004G0100 [Candidatus Giovannonibacteria bacterium GW2011_GWB1_44_23]KKT63989.1 MAG: hypothetical protein UW57_C0004G0099 [Candidatus Giovannonibacteria bacterium GW2011_GWA1_44_29]KKT83586.1 MAG: hypothetical protein UW81_C0015G0008 [Candidatus Giovannonibacteria bacterium GW2011_GWC2_44_9]KKT91182.1 MAG: hypothetical protein UW93_C0011G0006 [Parcubacteria group bacterium GW2011_GWC1_45_13]